MDIVKTKDLFIQKENSLKRYIIDLDCKNKSSVETFTLPNGTVAYTDGLSIEQYISSKPDKRLKVISVEEMQQRYKEHIKELQGPYEECTEEKYYEMLDILPPKRWYKLSDTIFMFFVGEPYSGSLHSIYIYDKLKDKYYTTIRDILMGDDELLQDFLGVS